MTIPAALRKPVGFQRGETVAFLWLPTAYRRWRDVWPGAAVTALLFWLGGYLIGLYLGFGTWASIDGAGGSLLAALLWIYYSAWIVLFGATFTHGYAERYGAPMVSHEDARLVDTSPAS